jgi:hypothetical protein
MTRDGILDVQQSADLSTHSLAVAKADSLGPVDENPDHTVLAANPQFQVGQLVSEALDGGLQQAGQFCASHSSTNTTICFSNKKWAVGPFLLCASPGFVRMAGKKKPRSGVSSTVLGDSALSIPERSLGQSVSVPNDRQTDLNPDAQAREYTVSVAPPATPVRRLPRT